MLKRNSSALVLNASAEWRPVSRWQALSALGALIYAVRLDDGVIKIGYTTKLPEREVTLRSHHNSTSSQLLAFAFGDYEDEQAIHESLSDDSRVSHGREFYHPTPEVLVVVNQMRAGLTLPPIAA